MARVGRTRYIYFRLAATDSSPVTGAQLADFTVLFLRNDQPCADGLVLTDKGSGLYLLTYTPSAPGTDYLVLYHAATDIRVEEIDDTDDEASFFGQGETVTLTENYGTPGALKVVAQNPQDYTLYVFSSTDWQAGRTEPVYALGSAAVLATGNWDGSIVLLAGTYHVVATNGTEVKVLAAFLKV